MNGTDNYQTPATRIVVIGVGGAGGNAVNRMIDDDFGVEFYVMNTDLQSLQGSKVPSNNRILLGPELTGGQGAGGDTSIGRRAAEASAEEIRNIVRGANLVFIAAGMGGGTGTGAAPIIAQICKEEKALTLAIVTRPFSFEGPIKKGYAITGLQDLKEQVDAIIIVSNDKLLMSNGSDKIDKAFETCDQVLSQAVKTITDLILMPGTINLDFADIKKTLEQSGVALIGYGIGEGANKATTAAQEAISSSLLETPIIGARRMICAVTCGPEVSLFDAQDCVNKIVEEAGKDVDIKFGISINDQLGDKIIVSIIASDFATETDFAKAPTYDIKNDNKENDVDAEDNGKEEKQEEKDDILPGFLKGKIID